ncbi:MAG: MGDG synthase family glycosyltransferase [Candidatus Dormibacteria bacterium]
MPALLLFLIADTGGGHRASANAVRRYFEEEHPGEFEIRIVDPFVEAAPRWTGAATNLYGPIIQNARWLWGGIYHATNSRPAMVALQGTVLRSVEKGIERLCDEVEPAAIVSFHPLLNHISARVARRRSWRQPQRAPVITVITDLVDVHAAWACRDADLVITPSPGGVSRCRRAGIPADRVMQIGLPVDPAFTSPPPTPEERRELRRSLGIDPQAVTVLVCSGADGSGGVDRRAVAIARANLAIELVVICGRNERVRRHLAGLQHRDGRPVTVLGFVSNMAEWMRAADICVTKAGPGTIAEALCCGLPLLLNWYLPGQERGNVEWVVDIGAGRYVPGVRELVDTVGELSAPRSPALAAMRTVVNRVARPDATARIAELVRSFATAGAAAAATQRLGPSPQRSHARR